MGKTIRKDKNRIPKDHRNSKYTKTKKYKNTVKENENT